MTEVLGENFVQENMGGSLAQRIKDGGYEGYAYAYPHKTAYRALDPPIAMGAAWKDEPKDNLFLYIHIPFCEMRCGFCNLFTTILPQNDLVEHTLEALEKQSEVVARSLQPERVSQAAIGGGTPSYLSEHQLERLFRSIQNHWPVDWLNIPISVESSPATVTPSKLRLLKELGVKRLSIGIQSFTPGGLKSIGRPQTEEQVMNALEAIKEQNFEVFNLDLIYGHQGQSLKDWAYSVEKAIEWSPEEIYLYPLYVGKLTGLDSIGRRPGDHRRALYQQARDRLVASGYGQVSMRLFRKPEVSSQSDYCCQRDGMVGLGPGARSYTKSLHYSSEYAVGRAGVRRIITDFCQRSSDSMNLIDYGIKLDLKEQKIRFALKSLLRTEGLCAAQYFQNFGTRLNDDLPQLTELLELELGTWNDDILTLNEKGLAYTDTIGPWLYSDSIQREMDAYQLV